MAEQPNAPKPLRGDLIWRSFAKIFLFFAGLIITGYGLDGLIWGDIVPAAGRGMGYDASIKRLTGLGGRLYGLVFVCLGIFTVALTTSLASRMKSRRQNKASEKMYDKRPHDNP